MLTTRCEQELKILPLICACNVHSLCADFYLQIPVQMLSVVDFVVVEVQT